MQFVRRGFLFFRRPLVQLLQKSVLNIGSVAEDDDRCQNDDGGDCSNHHHRHNGRMRLSLRTSAAAFTGSGNAGTSFGLRNAQRFSGGLTRFGRFKRNVGSILVFHMGCGRQQRGLLHAHARGLGSYCGSGGRRFRLRRLRFGFQLRWRNGRFLSGGGCLNRRFRGSWHLSCLRSVDVRLRRNFSFAQSTRRRANIFRQSRRFAGFRRFLRLFRHDEFLLPIGEPPFSIIRSQPYRDKVFF